MKQYFLNIHHLHQTLSIGYLGTNECNMYLSEVLDNTLQNTANTFSMTRMELSYYVNYNIRCTHIQKELRTNTFLCFNCVTVTVRNTIPL
jgi:hypothetical protein